ncbi:CLUMA_CG020361, isoform A [Clunio marinus]|uniref:CLUMA_CG020361, isoform A n=1 Tax=Clunio marinus TaxID=568069 RepID=A0A1J1J4Q8_9DIPT|nr:CLUMA_CG020361, isoform A [Clunio marinus]
MLMKLLILYVSIFNCAISEWTFKAGPADDVSLNLDSGSAIITMKEEIPPPLILGLIDNYDEDQVPLISAFYIGRPQDLDLSFEKNMDNEWEMIVNNKQDYEQSQMRNYIFMVKIDEHEIYVQINVINIFDNAPILLFDMNICKIPELTESNYDTGCIYNVYDADGLDQNDIRISIEDTRGEADLFEFVGGSSIDEYNTKFSLKVKQPLYFDKAALFNFDVKVLDAGNNSGTFKVLIEVIDIPNKPPLWIKTFAPERFKEKTNQIFEVEAIDGDTGINTEICYKLEFLPENEFYKELISIEETTGIIHVQPIDRDALKIEFYPFDIYAYKCNNDTSFVTNSATLIVDDVNDNSPEIFIPIEKKIIKLMENSFNTLFESTELIVDDIDLGDNASYDIFLKSSEGQEFANAFSIIPSNGYQRQGFTINVLNKDLLDYEMVEWQQFELMIIAIEHEHNTTESFTVELLNWNDETPEFTSDLYVFEVLETAPENYDIGKVTATDRDIDDSLIYSLSGTISNLVSISETGDLKTKRENAFDYETQPQVSFRVQVADTLKTMMDEPPHVVFTEIRIDVIDVNDEAPRLTMPRQVLTVLENTLEDVIVTEDISAFDPDTSSALEFSINWENSYALKSGIPVENIYYEGCFQIESSLNGDTSIGVLKTSTSFEYDIDFERFDIIHLEIVVEDTNQTILPNSASAMLVINIKDENDNKPEFVGDTLTLSRDLVEDAKVGNLIGNIIAIDIDGPGNNIIKYSISSFDDDTPDEWIEIDSVTGVLTVSNPNISCDVPRIEYLNYQISISDGVYEEVGNIAIYIIDINNKFPEPLENELEFSIYENATSGELITQIFALDLDRDAPHNVISYYIDFESFRDLSNYFMIDELSGELSVRLIKELDRDNGIDEYFIPITLEDNYLGRGVKNTERVSIHLTLEDVNDNAPQMPSSRNYMISENADESIVIEENFEAPDKDKPNTFNSEVLYEILSLELIEHFGSIIPENYDNLFDIISYDNKYGQIRCTQSLRGFSGKWKIQIRAYDRGDLGDSRVSLSSTESYYIIVEPFNFNDPKITFPLTDALLRIDFDIFEKENKMILTDGNVLLPFEAVDEDAGNFGDINFELSSNNNNDDHTYFDMLKLNEKQSELKVKEEVEERTYSLNVIAYDGAEPYFDPNASLIDFTENDEGREEIRILPEAFDPKNKDVINENDKYKIFYYIDEEYQQEDTEFFNLDKDTRELTLVKNLDRETKDRHQLRIICTNLNNYPTQSVSDSAKLIVEISVNDVNDNSPKFQYENYYVGISEQDNIGKILLTFIAHDPDLNDVVSYHLLTDTIVATGENLESVKNRAFELNQANGVLSLNFRITDTNGFFEFKVEARDLVNHTDETMVKVYLITEINRLSFTFLNDVETVRSVDTQKFTDILRAAYDTDECNIDEIQGKVESDGTMSDTLTTVRVHFIRDNEAVDAAEITRF